MHIGKPRAPLRHLIQMRRADGRVVRSRAFRIRIIAAQITIAEVVGHHKDDVRLLRGQRGQRGK